MKILYAILLSICPLLGICQSNFEDYKKQEKINREKFKHEQQTNIQKLKDDYQAYVKAEAIAYAKFVQETSLLWGKNNVSQSTSNKWVEYSANKKSRSIVDFEKGIATVEILVSSIDNEERRNLLLQQGLCNLIQNCGTTKDYDSTLEPAQKLSDKPILSEQLQNNNGECISDNNIKEFISQVSSSHTTQKITGDDGSSREVCQITIPLAPDHIKTRATQYIDDINTYSKKYNMNPALIYAVIHIESYFNPKATSPIPAYGLMQIVPKYAGKDAYKYIYGQVDTPTANYLYDPTHNIELGAAYLFMQYTKTFADVKNEKCRTLCIIAAYNTGAGNVCRAFTGKTNVKNAVAEINTYSYEDLYKYLCQKLTYKEARDYVQKVSEKVSEYESWISK